MWEVQVVKIVMGVPVEQQLLAVERFPDLRSLAFWMLWKFPQLFVSLFECAARFCLKKDWNAPKERSRCAVKLLLSFRESIPYADASGYELLPHFPNLIHPGERSN